MIKSLNERIKEKVKSFQIGDFIAFYSGEDTNGESCKYDGVITSINGEFARVQTEYGNLIAWLASAIKLC